MPRSGGGGGGGGVSKKQHEETSTRLPVVRVRSKRGGKRRERKSGPGDLLRRKTGQTEAGWGDTAVLHYACLDIWGNGGQSRFCGNSS